MENGRRASMKRPPPLDFSRQSSKSSSFYAKQSMSSPTAPASIFTQRLQAILRSYKNTKKVVREGLDDPSLFPASKLFSEIIFAAILLSIFILCISSLPQFENEDSVWFGFECIFSAIFTIEIILQFWTSPSALTYVSSLQNWIDCISTLPFYFELIFQSGTSTSAFKVLRVFRITRVFRLFKLAKYAKAIRLILLSFSLSASILATGVILLLLIMIVFASAIYFLERGTLIDGVWKREHFLTGVLETSPFSSIPATFYYMLTTMTTTGYGDIYPYSTGGKLISVLAMVFGMLIIALPASVLATHFTSLYSAFMRSKERRLKQAIGVPCILDRGLPTERTFLVKLSLSPVTEEQHLNGSPLLRPMEGLTPVSRSSSSSSTPSNSDSDSLTPSYRNSLDEPNFKVQNQAYKCPLKISFLSPDFTIQDLVRIASMELELMPIHPPYQSFSSLEQDNAVEPPSPVSPASPSSSAHFPISCEHIIAVSYTGEYALQGPFSLPSVLSSVHKKQGELADLLPDIEYLEFYTQDSLKKMRESVLAAAGAAVSGKMVKEERANPQEVQERKSSDTSSRASVGATKPSAAEEAVQSALEILNANPDATKHVRVGLRILRLTGLSALSPRIGAAAGSRRTLTTRASSASLSSSPVLSQAPISPLSSKASQSASPASSAASPLSKSPSRSLLPSPASSTSSAYSSYILQHSPLPSHGGRHFGELPIVELGSENSTPERPSIVAVSSSMDADPAASEADERNNSHVDVSQKGATSEVEEVQEEDLIQDLSSGEDTLEDAEEYDFELELDEQYRDVLHVLANSELSAADSEPGRPTASPESKPKQQKEVDEYGWDDEDEPKVEAAQEEEFDERDSDSPTASTDLYSVEIDLEARSPSHASSHH